MPNCRDIGRRVMRVLVLGGLLLAAGASLALGQDDVVFHAIGFSEDGASFVFEEFSPPGESGYAYASVQRVPIGGAQSRATLLGLVAEEQAVRDLTLARQQALQQANRALPLGPIDGNARLLASQPFMEVGADPYLIRFARPEPTSAREPGDVHQVVLEPTAIRTGDCTAVLGKGAVGFTLKVRNETKAQTTPVDVRAVVAEYADSCPVDYRLVHVFVPARGAQMTHAAVVIAVILPGPSVRHLVVGAPL